MLNDALPAASGAIPSAAVPSSTVTLPVGTPLVVLATCIVSVTDAPNDGVLVDGDTVSTVGALAIVRLPETATTL